MRTAVLGAGSWGTTFAKVVGDAGHPVTVLARRDEVAAEIREHRTNSAYLGDIALGHNVTATTDAPVRRPSSSPFPPSRCGTTSRPSATSCPRTRSS